MMYFPYVPLLFVQLALWLSYQHTNNDKSIIIIIKCSVWLNSHTHELGHTLHFMFM